MMKKFLFSMIVLLLILAGSAQAKKSSFHLDETYPINSDGTIFLYSEDADVLIAGSDRDDVHVVVDYAVHVSGIGIESREDDFEVIVTEENGNLRIREMETNSSFSGILVNVETEYTITIQAPSTVSLQIVGDDDDYMISGFSGGVRLRMEDGDARLRDMTGEDFEFELEDGDIDLSGGSGYLDVSVEDGSFNCTNGSFTSATGDTEDGEIRMETTLSNDGEYRFRAEDGAISLMILGGGGEFSVYYEDGDVHASRDFKREEEDDNYSRYTLPGGNAVVRFRVEDGDVRLRTK